MDTPALDHVSYGALADLQSFGGLFCGEGGEVCFSSLFHGRNYRQDGKYVKGWAMGCGFLHIATKKNTFPSIKMGMCCLALCSWHRRQVRRAFALFVGEFCL